MAKYTDEYGKTATAASAVMLGEHVRCDHCGYQVGRPGLAGQVCNQGLTTGYCPGILRLRAYYVGVGN